MGSKKISKLAVYLMVIMIAVVFSGCEKKTSTVSTENEEINSTETETSTNSETKKKGYEIKKSNYDESKGDVPVVRIETSNEVNMNEYVSTAVTIEDGTNQYATISDMNARIKVRGHSSAIGKKTPYNIKLEEKQNVLGMGESKKWCLIANMFDPTQMRNKLVLDFARNMGMAYVSECEYVEVFFNGEDMGLYLMCEPVKDGKDQIDIDDEKDYLLQLQPNMEYTDKPIFVSNAGMILSVEEGGEIEEDEEIEEEERVDTTNIKKFIDEFELSIAYGYEGYSKYLNMDSFVDYYVINELFKDVDFATSSAYFYVKDNVIYAGPVWDYDLSSGNASDTYTEYNNIGGSGESSESLYCEKLWFYYLLKDKTFAKAVRERYEELQPLIENLTQDNSLGVNRINEILNNRNNAISHNYTIWNVSEQYSQNERVPMQTYDENVEYLRSWIENRNKWLDENLPK